MTLTGMKKHVGVLERAGLVTNEESRARADVPAGPAPIGGRRRCGSRGTAGAGTNASTRWTTLSRNSHARRRAMNARIGSEPGPVKKPHHGGTEVGPRGGLSRGPSTPGAHRVRGIYQGRAAQALVVPKSMGMTLLSCEVEPRVGGKYRLVFDHGGPEPAAFFGTYVEVKPHSRLAWTNDEGGEGGSVTTVTFEEKGGRRWWSCARAILRRKRSTLRHRSSRCNGRDVRSAGRASRRPG